jgi:hypothetical protein
MKTAVRKGKATTCLAYGYKLKLAHDAMGDRIPGLHDIRSPQGGDRAAGVQDVRRGRSSRDIAQQLNREGVIGPRGAKWRDNTIRGHVSRGTGILNNETYVGRVLWNRRNYRKNPETERRVAPTNSADDWVSVDSPELRIIDDVLWTLAKARQSEVVSCLLTPRRHCRGWRSVE